MLLDSISSAATSGDLGFESNCDGSMVFNEDVQSESLHGKDDGERKVKDYLKATVDERASLLKSFCRLTSAHGFRCATSSERSRSYRCLWTLATLVATFSLAGALLELLCNYHCYPVKTVIDIKYPSQLPFPAVTLCNLRSFNCWKADLLPNVVDGGRKLCEISSMYSLKTLHGYGDMFSDPQYQDILNMPASEIYRAASIKMNETLQFCSWNNERKPCEEIFSEVFGLEGTCFQFNHNSTNPVNTSSIGPMMGLSVLVSQPWYTDHAATTGLKVLLHNPGTYPDVLTQGYLIPPGFTTFGRVHLRQTSHLPYPYKSFGENYCIDQAPGVNSFVYNRESCISMCVFTNTIKVCNCSLGLDDWQVFSEFECSFRQLLSCVHPTFARLHREAVMSSDVCSHCNYGCRVAHYSLSTSQASLPSIYNTLDTVHDVNGENISSNSSTTTFPPEEIVPPRVGYLELRLFFDQMIKEEIRYQPEYTWDSMIGIVGGQMGFFIGASILTLLEILECIGCLLGLLIIKTIKKLWPRQHQLTARKH